MANDTEELDILELDSSLSDAERPPEVPVGTFLAEIQDVQVATSQNKGNRYYAIKFVIPPGELPADVRDDFEDGGVLFWNRQIVPTGKDRRALFNLRNFIEAIGLDSYTTTINPNDWMGCQARIRVRHKVFEGERKAEIQSILPVDEAPPARGRQQQQEPEEEPVRPEPRTARRAGRGR